LAKTMSSLSLQKRPFSGEGSFLPETIVSELDSMYTNVLPIYKMNVQIICDICSTSRCCIEDKVPEDRTLQAD
jgi:hypothetical protein